MAKKCFCGCGRRIPRFPLGMRAINKRGQQVVRHLEWSTEAGFDPEDSDVAAWRAEGEAIKRDLMGAMHGEIDPSSLDEARVRSWQKIARSARAEVERRYAALGKAARAKGYTAEEAAQAIARGEWDPFAE